MNNLKREVTSEEKIYNNFVSGNRYNKKDDEASLKYRTNGNEYYKKQYFKKAMELYNKSICYAEPNSVNLAQGFLNKSAIMMQANEYEKCLEIIETIKSIQVELPPKSLEILTTREKRCLEAMNNQKTNTKSDLSYFDFNKLSYTPNSKINYIIDDLEVRNTLSTGRGVFTKKALYPGDLILIEESFSACFSNLEAHSYLACHNCFQEKGYSLYPCDNCTLVMYCNKKCQKEDEIFHTIECPMIHLLTNVCKDMLTLPVKVLIKVLNEYNFDIEKCNQEVMDGDKLSVENTQEYFENILIKRNGCLGISDLQANSEKVPLENLDIIAVILNRLLTEKTSVKNLNINNQHMISNLLLKFAKTVKVNNFHLEKRIRILQNFVSRFNHSCAPNCILIYKNKKEHCFVVKNVRKNEQLSLTYGPEVFNATTSERRAELILRHGFVCECEFCFKKIDSLRLCSDKREELDFMAVYPDFYINNKTKTLKMTKELLLKCIKHLRKYSTKNNFNINIFIVENEIHNCLSPWLNLLQSYNQ